LLGLFTLSLIGCAPSKVVDIPLTWLFEVDRNTGFYAHRTSPGSRQKADVFFHVAPSDSLFGATRLNGRGGEVVFEKAEAVYLDPTWLEGFVHEAGYDIRSDSASWKYVQLGVFAKTVDRQHTLNPYRMERLPRHSSGGKTMEPSDSFPVQKLRDLLQLVQEFAHEYGGDAVINLRIFYNHPDFTNSITVVREYVWALRADLVVFQD
jgi:hypothetical protein